MILAVNVYAVEENITITAFYPIPKGSYREIKTDHLAVGEGYSNSTWQGPTALDANTKLIVEGNVGIGTKTPTATLDVKGKIAIRGGNPGIDKILKVDNTGLASWQPINKVNNLVVSGPYRTAADMKTTYALNVLMGKHFFCALTAFVPGVGSNPSHEQACMCNIVRNNDGTWTLFRYMDSTQPFLGDCVCEARCVDQIP